MPSLAGGEALISIGSGFGVHVSGTELDYTEQTSWLLFLKYLDGLEDDKAAVAALEGHSSTPILEEAYRWNSWAAPKTASGELDHHAALTGDDLRDVVNQGLFP